MLSGEIKTMMTKRALHFMTCHASLSNIGRGAGFYYDEMAVPYRPIRELSGNVTLASVAGGARLPDTKKSSWKQINGLQTLLDLWTIRPR